MENIVKKSTGKRGEIITSTSARRLKPPFSPWLLNVITFDSFVCKAKMEAMLEKQMLARLQD